MKRVLRRIVPPRAIALLRRLKPASLSYSRPYDSWDEACRHAGSYADPVLLDEERNAARAVREGRAAYALFGLPQSRLAFRWPLIANLLAIAAWQGAFAGRPLHVLDYGGGLGSVYQQHRRYLDTIPALLWSVVEQPHFVRCGNSEFADDRLRFFQTARQAGARARIDAAIFVGSLEYLEDPYAVLQGLIDLDVPYLLLIATHWSDSADDVVRVQHIRPPYVTADVPIRFLSRAKLLALLGSRSYEMFAELRTGYLFRRTPLVTD